MFTTEELQRHLSHEIKTMRKAAGLSTRDDNPEEIYPEKEETVPPNNIRRVYHF